MKDKSEIKKLIKEKEYYIVSLEARIEENQDNYELCAKLHNEIADTYTYLISLINKL